MNARWTSQDVARTLNKARSRYGAKKVQIDGIWFDSKREGVRYVELRTMRAAGLITFLECHPKYRVGIKGIFICDVELDFAYWDCSQQQSVFEDVKSPGTNTALSKLKRKMVEAEYGIVIELVGL